MSAMTPWGTSDEEVAELDRERVQGEADVLATVGDCCSSSLLRPDRTAGTGAAGRRAAPHGSSTISSGRPPSALA